ncbi:unnamed protein product [Lactuca virosa]|uniref:Uncharacterized protein n=1 Tax=Lactuca virosa TaxID=75947 RepID=A0AAU9MKD4_9ASTR|nr:unnamed protein product [Lactuca virosa]
MSVVCIYCGGQYQISTIIPRFWYENTPLPSLPSSSSDSTNRCTPISTTNSSIRFLPKSTIGRNFPLRQVA